MSQFKKFENFPPVKTEVQKMPKREVLRCFGVIFALLAVVVLLAYVICLNERLTRLEEIIERQSQGGSDITSRSGFGVTNETISRAKRHTRRRSRYNKKYGCSLVSSMATGQYIPGDRIFRWTRADDLADCPMRTTPNIGGGIQQIRIQEDGLYYVYAQLTYTENPLIPNVEAPMGGQISFEIIMHDVDAVPVPRDVVLMRSISHTRPSTNTPTPTSSHVGGLHKLFINQVIYVRERTPSRKYSMHPEENYFGVFLVERGP